MLKRRDMQFIVLPSTPPSRSILFFLHPILCPGHEPLPTLSPKISCWVASECVLLMGSTSKGLEGGRKEKSGYFFPSCSGTAFLEGWCSTSRAVVTSCHWSSFSHYPLLYLLLFMIWGFHMTLMLRFLFSFKLIVNIFLVWFLWLDDWVWKSLVGICYFCLHIYVWFRGLSGLEQAACGFWWISLPCGWNLNSDIYQAFLMGVM